MDRMEKDAAASVQKACAAARRRTVAMEHYKKGNALAAAQGDGIRARVFAASWAVIFAAAGVSAYSVFKTSIMEATGGTDSQISMAYTIQSFCMAILGIFSGAAVDKAGPKKVIYIGGLLYSLGWLVSGLTASVPMFYLFFGVVNGVGSGLIYNSSVATGLKWYPEKKGTMSGLLLMSASIGPFITSRVGEILCNGMGLGAKGLSAIGAFYFFLIWGVGWIMEVPGKDWKAPAAPASVKNMEKADKEYSPRMMVATLRFWLMIGLMCLGSMTGIMFIGALSGIAQAQLGVGSNAASWIVGFSALANFAGRISIGKICDKLGETKSMLLILAVTILSLLIMKNAFTVPLFLVCLLFIGAAFGGVLVCFPPMTQKTFGMANSGVNYGIMFVGYAVGSYFGPQIAANTKVLGPDGAAMVTSYARAYDIAMAVGVAGICVCLLLMAVKKRYARQAAG